jgi:hypothetical protein
MWIRKLVLGVGLMLVGTSSLGQNFPRWNATVGGGVGFPEGTSANFANNGANFVIGAGPNLRSYLGIDGEFMWQDLPIKRGVVEQLQVPAASAREYALTLNAIFRVPTHGKLGFYGVGGGGWYHRSGELTTPALVKGSICEPCLVWWGGCVNGLVPGNLVLASASSNAFGGNVGGGITYPIGSTSLKLFTEIRYHHAPNKKVNSDLLPLTLGLRW